jgi:ABC-type phosphate transport system permease subunit
VDIEKAFGYVLSDERWITKILIAAAILLAGILLSILVIPAIVAFALLAGYQVEITRRVIHGDPQPLPEWDNWGNLLTDGLKVFVIGLVYALPIILVSLCLGIPAGILAEDSEGASQILSAIMNCFNLLWSIPMGLLLPAAIASFVAQNDMAAAFRFDEVFALVRDNFATYLIVLLLGWVAGFIGGLGFALCFLPGLVTAPYSGWVKSHLYGQAYLQATGKVSQPTLEKELA